MVKGPQKQHTPKMFYYTRRLAVDFPFYFIRMFNFHTMNNEMLSGNARFYFDMEWIKTQSQYNDAIKCTILIWKFTIFDSIRFGMVKVICGCHFKSTKIRFERNDCHANEIVWLFFRLKSGFLGTRQVNACP